MSVGFCAYINGHVLQRVWQYYEPVLAFTPAVLKARKSKYMGAATDRYRDLQCYSQRQEAFEQLCMQRHLRCHNWEPT
jgi:hypothetical protein